MTRRLALAALFFAACDGEPSPPPELPPPWTPTVAAGSRHSCALAGDGSLWCWGANRHGQLGDGTRTPPDGPIRVGEESDWIAVVVGESHTCGLREPGLLWCWGQSSWEYPGLEAEESYASPVAVDPGRRFLALAAGDGFTCGVRADRSVWCGGAIGYRRWRPEDRWHSVSAAPSSERSAACAVDLYGTPWCWRGTNTPEPLLSDREVVQLAGQQYALDPGGRLWRLDDSTEDLELLPVDDERYLRVAADQHACALRRDRSLWCWGAGEYGPLGDGAEEDREAPTQVAGAAEWADVDAGRSYTCGRRGDGSVWCWGKNGHGQVGYSPDSLEPVEIGAGGWTAAVAASSFACALDEDRALWCWGDSRLVRFPKSETPERISFDDWLSLSGNVDACGIREPGELFCWAGPMSPRAESDASDWTAVSSGRFFECGLRGAGGLWCKGINQEGQLGDGTNESRYLDFVRIGSHSDWTAVSAGDTHTCGIRAPGTLWCWGEGEAGRLGGGDTEARNEPARVGAASDWIAVSAGVSHTCGLRAPGTLWCWGAGSVSGGAGAIQTEPKRVGGESDWVSVSSGAAHACGLREGGSIWCWGDNPRGQLGDGSREPSSAPVRVGAASEWTEVVSGRSFACGLRADGTLWCWGANSGGQLADGRAWSTDLIQVDVP